MERKFNTILVHVKVDWVLGWSGCLIKQSQHELAFYCLIPSTRFLCKLPFRQSGIKTDCPLMSTNSIFDSFFNSFLRRRLLWGPCFHFHFPDFLRLARTQLLRSPFFFCPIPRNVTQPNPNLNSLSIKPNQPVPSSDKSLHSTINFNLNSAGPGNRFSRLFSFGPVSQLNPDGSWRVRFLRLNHSKCTFTPKFILNIIHSNVEKTHISGSISGSRRYWLWVLIPVRIFAYLLHLAINATYKLLTY